MNTAFVIYFRAIGLYCLVTLPAIVLPIMYIISLFYAAIYGWFACALFVIVYVLADHFKLRYLPRMLVLSVATVASVLLAYQMMEVIGVEDNVWQSEFILFPVAAIISGWVSLFTLAHRVKEDCPDFADTNDAEETEESIF